MAGLKDHIKELCKQNGVSMKTVEKELGFGVGYLSKLDASTPSSENLQLLADYFGVPMSELSALAPKKKKITAVFHKTNSVHKSIADENKNISTSSLFGGYEYYKEKVAQEVMKAIVDNTPSGYPVYYTDPETARIAQEVFDNPDLRMLFSAARDAKPEDIKLAADMLKRFKETNPDG